MPVFGTTFDAKIIYHIKTLDRFKENRGGSGGGGGHEGLSVP